MNAKPLVLLGKSKEISPGFSVRRVLPAVQQRSLGPFVFLDHMGPVTLDGAHAMDVGAHPHIGLSTLTYLYAARVVHRDSVGSVQAIEPGDVNWMTAGRGVSHSERTAPEDRGRPMALQGLQLWVALPREHEEDAPTFEHHPRNTLPAWQGGGAQLRLVAGHAYGRVSPVSTFHPMFFVDVTLPAGASVVPPTGYAQRGVYVVQGALRLGALTVTEGQLLVLDAEDQAALVAEQACTAVLLGGAPLPEPRFMWWNFVSTRRERVEQAKQDWSQGRIPLPPGETQGIALP